jgi:hypothetical protein
VAFRFFFSRKLGLNQPPFLAVLKR